MPRYRIAALAVVTAKVTADTPEAALVRYRQWRNRIPEYRLPDGPKALLCQTRDDVEVFDERGHRLEVDFSKVKRLAKNGDSN